MASVESDDDSSCDNLEFEWRLDTIPKELFLHICSFLSAKFVINVMSKVSIRFRDLIQNNATWKIRLREQFPKKYPIIQHEDDDEINWAEACVAREEQCRLWRNEGANMRKYHIKLAHNAPVDVVHIIENGALCASGSRDRDIKLWDLNAVNETAVNSIDHSVCVGEVTFAHEGWLWSMVYSPQNKILYTGSWDGSIKGWDIQPFELTRESNFFLLKSPVLCLAFSGDILVCGRYDKIVSAFDPRAGTRPIFEHFSHRKPVLCMAANEKFIMSGSEDHSLVIYNRIAGRVENSIHFDGYPFSLSYDKRDLWMGDSRGKIHLVDPFEDKFQLLKSYSSGHSARITGIHHSLGSIITCSSDKTLRVLEPCPDPATITTIHYHSEIARISAHEEVLVSANIDDSITVWMPDIDGDQS